MPENNFIGVYIRSSKSPIMQVPQIRVVKVEDNKLQHSQEIGITGEMIQDLRFHGISSPNILDLFDADSLSFVDMTSSDIEFASIQIDGLKNIQRDVKITDIFCDEKIK